jgi:hypothetical protein
MIVVGLKQSSTNFRSWIQTIIHERLKLDLNDRLRMIEVSNDRSKSLDNFFFFRKGHIRHLAILIHSTHP